MNAPFVHNKDNWPPNYVDVFAYRQRQLIAMQQSSILLHGAIEYYKTNPVSFIIDWVDTFDPRVAGIKNKLAHMPFVFFEKQADLITFFDQCRREDENGLVEKCRDAGVTWLACGYSVWCWRFVDGSSIGWGSRKEQLVDKIGDMDSIFEKMRYIIRRLPSEFYPKDFNPHNDKFMSYMRIINPENESTITGEAGDNIGRGGRKTIYFKDESAHYERPEKIEAALSDNTRCQIDISSVNGLGNVFHRKREAGIEWKKSEKLPENKTRVFVFDWSDHPEKTQEWHDTRKKKFENEGLAHIFAQEVERNYSAAISNTVIDDEWIQAAIDAHKKLELKDEDYISENWIWGLDIADDGGDTNALAGRSGVVLRSLEEWGERDVGMTARRAIGNIKQTCNRGELNYDSIGVGSGVKAEINRLRDEKKLPDWLIIKPWAASASVLKPHARIIEGDKSTPKNKDFFKNLKAQAWWSIRTRFYKTYRAVVEKADYEIDDLIILPSDLPMLAKLRKELAQVVYGYSGEMKIIINKAPEGMKSPNLADGVVESYFPASDNNGTPLFGQTSRT